MRDRYLVGVLAPSRSANAAAKPAVDEEIPLIPDELSEGGSDTPDDGKADAETPVTQAHLPSSFGMSFCVDGEAEEGRSDIVDCFCRTNGCSDRPAFRPSRVQRQPGRLGR